MIRLIAIIMLMLAILVGLTQPLKATQRVQHSYGLSANAVGAIAAVALASQGAEAAATAADDDDD